MKRLFHLLLFLFGISQTIICQVPIASTTVTSYNKSSKQIKNSSPKKSTQLYFLAKESFPLDEKGRQFLNNEFIEGVIIDFENETHQVPIRYRFFDDEMQILHLEKVKALYPQRVKKIIFSINGSEKTFAPISYLEKKSENLGFFEVKSSGKISLLKAYRSGKNGIRSQFLFKKENAPAEYFKLKKSNILNIFGAKKSQISKYIVKEKLNVKSEEDLKKIFDYYNNSMN